jgi:hypothetical protein
MEGWSCQLTRWSDFLLQQGKILNVRVSVWNNKKYLKSTCITYWGEDKKAKSVSLLLVRKCWMSFILVSWVPMVPICTKIADALWELSGKLSGLLLMFDPSGSHFSKCWMAWILFCQASMMNGNLIDIQIHVFLDLFKHSFLCSGRSFAKKLSKQNNIIARLFFFLPLSG